CSDAAELTEVATAMGLAVSERTAHRILGGELVCLEALSAQLTGSEDPAPEAAPDIYRDRRSLRIHHSDLGAFRRELTRAFDVLADRYYLTLKGEPRVTIGRDTINVRFGIEKDD
ncbi:MAG: ATP-binding protein, partial [Actinomycetota bacterium]|nr:ATP-binding protein [Actinomycetota bacterium]